MPVPPRPESAGRGAWLDDMLRRHASADYLRSWGAPTTLQAYREQVPVTDYETLAPWLARVAAGEPDVLFAGRPCAFERTGGSSGGAKLIPYSAAGLDDFQAALAPWLADVVGRHAIEGSVYLATSPATRGAQQIAGLPLGLPDGAYLGPTWGGWVARHTAVTLDVAAETDMARWRERTVEALAQARDLELISVWSPTFLLRLLDHLPDPRRIWPRLKLVSCWTAGASRGPADELRARLPHAHLQPKGLMSTEGLVTVPDAQDRPVLVERGFFEFEREGRLCLPEALDVGDTGDVVLTTASGLYRYRTGDRVRCTGITASGQPILDFLGRSGIVCDLVGEKLVEVFVQEALADVPGGAFLSVQPKGAAGYVVVTEAGVAVDLQAVESRLMRNPQYAYARQLNQLLPLAHRPVRRLYDRFVAYRLAQGTRLADIKPVALMPEAGWIDDA